jgi:tetratricopeptide (TPR) repeat protein
MTEENDPVVLTEESVTAFAMQMENSITGFRSDTAFLNHAFDKKYIQSVISDHPIVYSALNTDFGQQFFNHSFTFGDEVSTAVENGGDFRFVRYYEKNGEHHLLMHLYRDFSLKIFDFVLDTVNSQIKIKDGFLYDLSDTYSNQIRYNVVYGVLQKTNPEGVTSVFMKINQLFKDKKVKEVQKCLKENQTLLQEYPVYQYYRIQNSFDVDPKNHIAFLEQLETEGLDTRTVLLYKMHYYCNTGKSELLLDVIDKLIDYTGDDPIYLLFYGKSCFVAKKYEEALYCYENAEAGMPLIWDLWFGKLECYTQLKMKKEFDATLALGKELYGMSDEDLKALVKNYFD